MKPTQFKNIARSTLWSTAGSLPHYHGSAIQFVTYCLKDAVPKITNQQKRRLSELPHSKQQRAKQIWAERLLDRSLGSCLLGEVGIAQIVIDAWQFYDGKRYDLMEWTVMPNHGHVLAAVYPNMLLGTTVGLWKSYTSKAISKALSLEAKNVWQRGYFDRFIRDEAHYHQVVSYIHRNAVVAGLAEHPQDWKWWSSYCENR